MHNIHNSLSQVSGISHPLIADMYLKRSFGDRAQNILVIETRNQDPENKQTEHNALDSYLIDLLIDLEDLKEKAEKKVGTFDRVDIRRN